MSAAQRIFAVGILIAISGGCGNPGSGDPAGARMGSRPGAADSLRIAVVPKATSLQYWKAVHAGAEQAAEELGNVQIIWKGPAQENNTAGQIEVVRNMITQRVDGICLAPNHSESLVSAVQEANDESIPVVVFDSGLGEGANTISYVATDNRNGGRLAAQRLAEALGEQGEVILLRYRAGSESTGEREDGFLEEIAKYAKIRVVSSDQYGEATTKAAMDKAMQLLLRYEKEVDGIFAVCEPNCHGILQALEQTGLSGKVKFIAFDPSDMLIQGMKSGAVHGIVLQDPKQIGYLAVTTIVAHLQGVDVDARISTGEYVATPENMDSERMSDLLHPKLFGE